MVMKWGGATAVVLASVQVRARVSSERVLLPSSLVVDR